MFERAGRGDRAVILHPVFADTGPDAIEEFKDLARSAGVEVAAVLTAPRDRPDPTFFVGRGKIDERDMQALIRVGAELERLPLFIDDTGGLSIAQVAARCRWH